MQRNSHPVWEQHCRSAGWLCTCVLQPQERRATSVSAPAATLAAGCSARMGRLPVDLLQCMRLRAGIPSGAGQLDGWKWNGHQGPAAAASQEGGAMPTQQCCPQARQGTLRCSPECCHGRGQAARVGRVPGGPPGRVHGRAAGWPRQDSSHGLQHVCKPGRPGGSALGVAGVAAADGVGARRPSAALDIPSGGSLAASPAALRWNAFGSDLSEEVICSTAQLMGELGLVEAGYQ